ncbi:MAG: DUF3800 domain-containing protein [Anaerolineales bacterium]|nr:DUF3800 domain-containing protein [Anaerolineales bacterium]
MGEEQSSLVHHYFVDEAGDLTLFNKKGQTLLGQTGVSYFFMVGVAHVADPIEAQTKLETLRQELLADPYFASVPSMQPEQKKTALAFHAKDDLPEVRREVFKLLPQLGAKVQVAIRSKSTLIREAQALYRYQRRKLDANDVYDGLVKRLFQNMLHKADHNQITFARRGTSNRSEALDRAIRLAKQNFAARWGNRGDTPTTIASAYPHEAGGLQIIDYYLWALQRLYEQRESRFFDLLAQDYRLIMDLDDKRHKPYGTWYSDSNPLTVEKLAWTFSPKK